MKNISEEKSCWSSYRCTPATQEPITQNTEKNNSVAVILGYYNGDKFIKDQIKSIVEQSHKEITLFISDDNSNPEFAFKKVIPPTKNKILIKKNVTNQGFTKNFLYSLASIDNKFDYYAFSDQDDIWHKDKLSRAIKVLSNYNDEIPVLYCSRTEIVDESGEIKLGKSPLFKKAPSFSNSIVQNIAGGNTMVLNKAAKDLVANSTNNINVICHDWWCYLIISAAGGVIHYDKEPSLKYRQHSTNIIGANSGIKEKIYGIKRQITGEKKLWNNTNINALIANKGIIAPVNQQILNDIIAARNSSLPKRLFLFKRAGLYAQTTLGNISLFFSILFNKV